MEIEVGKVYMNDRGKGVTFRKAINIWRDPDIVQFMDVDDCGIPWSAKKKTTHYDKFRSWAVREHDPSTGERAEIK